MVDDPDEQSTTGAMSTVPGIHYLASDGNCQPMTNDLRSEQVWKFWTAVWTIGVIVAPILLVIGILLVSFGVNWGLPVLIAGAVCTIGFVVGRLISKKRLS